MSDSFWGGVQEAADNAKEAGYSNVNFGRLIATPRVLHWETLNEARTPVREDYKKGYVLKEDETLEITFTVMISELNPQLSFEYERTISVRKSGKVKTDWTEIVQPSLVAIFGKNWGTMLEAQPYVSVEDVPNIAGATTKKDPSKVWGVPKFLQAFKTKEECIAAMGERYKSRAGANGATAEVQVPEKVIKQVRGLVDSVGSAKALGMLKDKPFGDYDPQALLDLVGEAASE